MLTRGPYNPAASSARREASARAASGSRPITCSSLRFAGEPERGQLAVAAAEAQVTGADEGIRVFGGQVAHLLADFLAVALQLVDERSRRVAAGGDEQLAAEPLQVALRRHAERLRF